MIQSEEGADFEEKNKDRIKDVEKCFSSSVSLQSEGRKLVAKGIHLKVCRKKNKPRVFVLFDDILVYGDYVNDKSYKQPRILPLETMSIADVADTKGQVNAWQIKHPQKSFTVLSESALEKINWMVALEQTIAIKQSDLLRDGKWKKVEESPVWEPDSSVTKCKQCRKVFGALTRRHHCRKCGGVFCNACSKYKMMLPDQSNKPLRVCVACKMMDDESNEVGEKMTSGEEKDDQTSLYSDSSFDSYDDTVEAVPYVEAHIDETMVTGTQE